MKNIIKLSIISGISDKDHTILEMKDFAIRGKDTNGYNFECGNCGKILATNISYEQIRNLVLLCKCGKHNVVKVYWKVYVLKYLKEKINYPAIIVGFFLILIVSTNTSISIGVKAFLDVIIFIISFSHKYLIQVFQEK